MVWLLLFVREQVSGEEIGWVFLLGATALRIIVLIVLASLIWVPIGVWIGLRPQLAERVQPIVQFLAAFPANCFSGGRRTDPQIRPQPGDLAVSR